MFGYITRKMHTDAYRHSILSVQTYKVPDFAAQIGLTKDNAWGIIRHIANLGLKLEPGKYLLMKDPTKSILRLYDIPWETFEEGEDEDDEDDEFVDDEAGGGVGFRPRSAAVCWER